mgnify:FL=1
MGLADKILSFVTPAANIATADEATSTSPIVLIQHDGGFSKIRIPELGAFRFMVAGVSYEHTDTAEDGTWIYTARAY